MAAPADEQEAKRRKFEETAAETTEPAKEFEADAPADKRPKLKEAVGFRLRDCTLNVVPMHGGRVLAPLSDGGLQYLVGGARASAGAKRGRYCFEVKIIELMIPSDPAQALRVPVPQPKQMLKVGFATKESSLILGETSDSVCFDCEGFYTSETKREAKGDRIARDQTAALVLNLDPSSPNKNTVSLFKDGRRCSPPQPLPGCLVGKTLFPVVNFRNITLQVHFGPAPIVPLPFACRGFQDMAAEDAVVSPADAGKDGKYEVVLPVGLPDEGTFEWLDQFLAKNPQYTELSDRAIIKWAESSGMQRVAATSWKHSNDKPDVKFNIPMMDDWSVRRVLNSVIATQPRNYVVMEVKANLVASERAELLKRFSFPFYRKVAQVTVGDPPAEYTAKVQEEMLKQKQEEAEKAWSQRKAEQETKRAAEANLREAKRAAEAKLKELQDAQKAREAATFKEESKLDAEMKTESVEEGAVKKEEVKEEEKPEVKEEPKEEEKKAEEEEDEPKPVATLTDEEKAQRFRKQAMPDLTSWVLGTQFTKFSLPEAGEGFEEIRFSWAQAAQSEAYFKAWMLRQKILNRIEELQPGEWFKAKMPEWQRAIAEWHQKQADWKDPLKEAARKAAKEAAEAAKQAAEAPAEGGEAPAAEGGEPRSAEGGEKPAVEEEKPKDAPAKAEVVDAFAVTDILDIGDGEPLFAKFSFEDWALMSLRFELFMLAHSYTKDANDPERVGVHESNIAFYYNKYFRKTLSARYFGCETVAQVVELVRDAATVTQDSRVLATELGEDTSIDMFVKLTEDRRRVRQQAIDAGDDSVRLKFNTMPEAPPPAPSPQDAFGYKGAQKGGYGAVRPGATVPPPAPQPWYGGQKGGPYGGYGGKGGVVGPGGRAPVCRQWMAGGCQYGARCRYAHS